MSSSRTVVGSVHPNFGNNKGSFKYYVIKILTLFDPSFVKVENHYNIQQRNWENLEIMKNIGQNRKQI